MSNAWLLDLGMGHHAVVGGRELVHLLYSPLNHPVPGTPAHARRVIPWQKHLLPVLDLCGWQNGETCMDNRSVAGVFAYQQQPGEAPRYGALWLATPPTRLSVDDKQACDLPEPAPAWKKLALSCFVHEGVAVPILDLRRLYSTVLAD